MNQETTIRLAEKHSGLSFLRAETLPDSAEIDDASNEIGIPFSSDYRSFLLTFGAAIVGPYPIYGLRPVEVMGDDSWSVVEMTKQFRAEGVASAHEWIIFSSDHAGNPVGMDRVGKIWIYDHDFGGVAPAAENFEEYLRIWCLGIKDDSKPTSH
ncbi:MAG: SMI1/KNR4 family protein [Pirellulales bacterium]